jgi:hypothetical protein
MGEQVNAELLNYVDPETGAILDSNAVGTVVADIASDLQAYYDDAQDLKAPPDLEEAHKAFIEAAGNRLEQWQGLAEQATEFESIEALGVATMKSPAFQEACVALERAVDDNGLRLDLDCGDL